MIDKIKEGNELIAKFMGATKQIIPKGGLHGYKEGTELWMCVFSDNPDPLSYLAFNSEWDWIMPVVEKIGSLNRNMCGLTIGLFYEGDIVEVWRYVIDFIEWHNANKDENKNVSP